MTERPYIDDFMEAVYPGGGALALASFNEQTALEDATKRIAHLATQLDECVATAYQDERELRDQITALKKEFKWDKLIQRKKTNQLLVSEIARLKAEPAEARSGLSKRGDAQGPLVWAGFNPETGK